MFRRILIANRGEVAARIARTCRRMGIETVAVTSEPDRAASWLADVTEVVMIGPGAASLSYLNQDALLEVALAKRCSAVHPGWGFLAENTRFAVRCSTAGLTFIGPRAHYLRQMGDKALARSTMTALGIPCIPGSDGPVGDSEQAQRLAEEIGYPLLIKAVSGGGGRGMRVVEQPQDLAALFIEAGAEALSCFGDARLYLERQLTGARHVEVQIIGDRFGAFALLGERECSLQRRHQKILEEAPSPGLSETDRKALFATLGPAVGRLGYDNVGTLEMLLDSDGNTWFMEMNTRLQVEHSVTEEVTGLDLVEHQLRIAANERLDASLHDIGVTGHCIECRINAEDPEHDFRPSPGTLNEVRWPQGKGIRVDTHVQAGDVVPPFYDAMLGKVIVHASDRKKAIAAMKEALASVKITGVKTNLALQQRIMTWDGFVSGDYTITSLEHEILRN